MSPHHMKHPKDRVVIAYKSCENLWKFAKELYVIDICAWNLTEEHAFGRQL